MGPPVTIVVTLLYENSLRVWAYGIRVNAGYQMWVMRLLALVSDMLTLHVSGVVVGDGAVGKVSLPVNAVTDH